MTAVSTPLDPLIGINLSEILQSTDAKYNQIPLGTIVRAKNGRMYCFVEQSAVSIADNTAVVVTEPGFTIAAGAGAFTNRSGATPAAVARLWVESNAI